MRRSTLIATLLEVAHERAGRTCRGYFVPVIAVWRLFERQHAAIERAHRLRAHKARG